MGGNRGGRINHGVAECARVIALRRINPHRFETERWLFGRNAFEFAVHLTRIDRQFAAALDIAFAAHHAIEHDVINIRIKVERIANANWLNQETQFGRQFFTNAFDARHQLATGLGVHQWDQAIADFKTDQIDLINIIPIQFFRRIRFGFGGLNLGFFSDVLFFLNQHEAKACGGQSQCQEDHMRHARHDTEDGQNAGTDEEGRGVRQLRHCLLGHRFRGGDTGDDDRSRQRQEQRRNLSNQTIANRQQDIQLARFRERQVVLCHADRQTTDHINQQNQQTGDRIAGDEFRCTVHRTEEVRFLRDLVATGFGLFLSDGAGVQVGVNRHLLARHRIQSKTCIHFRHPTCTFGHDEEIHNHQDDENNQSHQVVTGDHKFAKGRYHRASRMFTFVAIDQNHPGRGHVQGQP